MSALRRIATVGRSRRFVMGGLALVGVLTSTSAVMASEATLRATYYIALAGFTIGRVAVDSWITDDSYSTIIDGSTYGISRLISDSRAILVGSGRIDGADIQPSAYSYLSSESGFESRVIMAMQNHAVTELEAQPELVDVPDRVPLTAAHRRGVVDPVGAFMISLPIATEPDGATVCDRTVSVFDGWQRYDVELTYKRTETVKGRGDSYSGPVIVCAARYVPVAGHRLAREAVQYMAQNERLEVWMVPVAQTPLMVPHRFVIGTKLGDLTVYARDFVVTASEQQASMR